MSVIAIVDDEADITTYLRIALEDEGYRVVSTTDAASAMELLVSEKPDLICLDLLMPQQTGVSLYAKLVSHPTLRDVPIVMLSGLTNRDGLPAMLAEAGDLPQPASFIEKPVEIDQFLATVRRLLGQAVT
jgi:DNA-binding response OmpR family regulator